jgi:ATP-binding cassette subfamily B protein
MVVCIAVLLTIEAICSLVLPSFMADIVNFGVIAGDTQFIWRSGISMLLITLFAVIVALAVGYFSAKTATGVANDLRAAVFNKVLHFSNTELNKFSTSSLITRTTNDITQIQSTMMMALRQFIYAPIIGVGGIVRALERSVSMTWIIALATLCLVGMLVILGIVAMPKFKMIQSLIDKLNLVSRENLSGILIVRAFSTQRFEKKRFDVANRELSDTNLFVDQAFAFLNPAIMLVLNLTTALVVWVGAYQVSAFRADIGDIFAFLQYGMLIIFAFFMVAIMFVLLPRALVSAGRIKEVLETESSIKYREETVAFLPVKSTTPSPSNLEGKYFRGIVEFHDVSFKYPDTTDDDENVLSSISFTAKPGETTAIIGATGSGKSTIFKLLLRFFDVCSGRICIDGIDIRDVQKTELHDRIGYVPQKALLFTGSIRSNLLYADKSATEERIVEAVAISQSTDFISEREHGYDSHIAQGGSNLSGGQRQRLSIARALVKNAPINLFDDCFSALDLKTDALLRVALKQKTGDSTMLVIAQRISTIMDADQIVVLDAGRVVGIGKHRELMETCYVYREIAASQLTAEEMNL